MDAEQMRAKLAARKGGSSPTRPGPSGDLPDDYRDLIGAERPAAVLVPVVLHHQLEVLLTRRTEHLKDHALFIAYAPLDVPEIAIAVIVENGGSGSRTAAPIARKLIDHYFKVTGM